MKEGFKSLCVSFIFALLLCHEAVADELVSANDSLPPTGSGAGYLLVKLNVGGEAPSIDYVMLSSEHMRFASKEKVINLHFLNQRKSKSLEMKQLPPGYYMVEMDPGLYQITRVNAPYYDLSFWLDTANIESWRFAITPGAVNYIGELVIDKERGKNYIKTDLYNRFAMHKSEIEALLPNLLKQNPLMLNPGYRDDFQSALMQGE